MYRFSFVLHQCEENLREDAADLDRREYLIAAGLPVDLTNPEYTEGLLKLEWALIAEIKATLGMRVTVYEHDVQGDLDCAIFCSTLAEVRKVDDFIQRRTAGGDCSVELATPYTVATEWVLYTNGVNGPQYGYGAYNYNAGTVNEWLSEQPAE